MAPAMARVPAANAASSKRPIGPYQNTVAAAAILSAAYRARGGRTDVEAHPAVGHINPVPHPRRDAPSSSSPRLASRRSCGSSSRQTGPQRPAAAPAGPVPDPRAGTASSRRGVLGPARNGKHIPPPITIASATSRKRPTAPILSVPGATDDDDQRPFGPLAMAWSPSPPAPAAARRGPAAGGRLPRCWRERGGRCRSRR